MGIGIEFNDRIILIGIFFMSGIVNRKLKINCVRLEFYILFLV